MNEYDLCWFYCVGLSEDIPHFPSPCKLAMCTMLQDLLDVACGLDQPNLLMAFARDSATVVCLLQELHNKDSMKCLLLEPKSDADGKPVNKLSFCPFCLYNGSNDISYMNHIVCGHYDMGFGCRKCLKEVFLSGQQLKMHLKACMGFPKGHTPSSSDRKPGNPMPQQMPKTEETGLKPKHQKEDALKRSSGTRTKTRQTNRSPARIKALVSACQQLAFVCA